MNEDKATRYHRQKRHASLVSLLWAVLLLGGLLATGLSTSLSHVAEAVAGRAVSTFWVSRATVLLYVGLLTLLNEVGSLPLSFYSGFLLERRYALSTQTVGGWMGDQLKGLAIGLALGSISTQVIYGLIQASPDWWWIEAGVIFALFMVALTNLTPVVLLPLFYAVKPLDREALRGRLLALADRAGARVLGVYEWGLGGKTKRRTPH